MQDFTLGKKGYSMLLFALILLIGSSPTFGQTNCPTVTDSSQDFCALATVSNLQATPNGDGLQWFDDQTSTDPIPSNEILEDNKVYFAGNNSNSCTGSRQTVTANVTDVGPPELAPGEDEFFTPCQRTAGDPDDSDNPDNNDIGTLKAGVSFNSVPGFTIEFYADEFDQNSPILPDNTELIPGTSYFAGLVGNDPNDCQTSSRTAIRYEPVVVPAPMAEPVQTVCPGTTVGELEASGTNRWYRTATSEPPLPNSTVLEDGKVYYATQIIPSDGPPCESKERTAVRVIIANPDAGNDNTGSVLCEAQANAMFQTVEDAKQFFLDLLDSGIDRTGSFNPTIESLATDFSNDPIGTFQTIYTVNDSGCEDSTNLAVTIEENENANAGNIDDLIVCSSDADIDMFTLLDNDATTSGSFNGYPSGTFSPSSEGAGTFTITYNVDGSSDPCVNGTDSESFTITVQDGGSAGADNTGTVLCEAEARSMFTTVEDARQFYLGLLDNGVARNGRFNPSIDRLAINFNNNPIGAFRTTYTVGSGDCQDSAILSITIEENQDANAGNIDDLIVCSSDADIDLFTLLDSDATRSGSFSGYPSGTFSPSSESAGTYTITYNVDSSTDPCVNGTDSESFTITVQDGGSAGADNTGTVLCEAEARSMFTTVEDARQFYLGLLDNGVARNGRFNPSIDRLAINFNNNPIGAFRTTYTVGSGDCQDSAILSITIEENQDANAGNIDDIIVCSNDEDITLSDLLDPNATEGSFEGYPDGVFSPSEMGAGSYDITFNTNNTLSPCVIGSDSVTFNITVQQAPNAGPDVTQTFCITEFQDLITSTQDAIDLFNSLLDPNADTGGVFNPSINSLVLQYTINPIGTFSSTYTVSNGQCEDKAEITVIIQDREDANAGGDVNLTFCTTDDDQLLTDYLTSGANKNGSFEGYQNGIFSPATLGAGTYTFKYTVDETSGDCIDGNDSSTFTIEVNQGVSAGRDKNQTLCRSEVRSIYSEGTARNYFLSLLDAGVPRTGTFNPTIQSLVDKYNDSGEKLGRYTSTYTVKNNNCSDSAEISVTIVANSSANAGEDRNLTFCSTEDDQNLYDYLSNEADKSGNFIGFANGLFNPGDNVGTTTIIYTVNTTGSVCTSGSDTSTFTITVNEPQDANAGGPVEANYCVEQDLEIDLKTILGEGAITTGSFSAPFEDGLFNPSEAGIGEFSITYTLNGSEDCAIGTDTATITITVTDLPDAPTADANQFFCLVDGPTVGDIVVTGTNVVIYTNSDLTDEADVTTTLVSGMSYYATSTSEGETCSSDAVEINVTITDPAAPLLSLDGNEFCRSDNPTVQALVNNFTGGVVIYNASTGGTTIQTNTPLQNGATYYAASVNTTSGCESSERTAVIAKVEFCGIPEGFSPNGDGINDRFVIPDIAENFPNYTIEFFNRYGNVVYKGNASTPDWDGISNESGTLGNDVLPVGVYFYILNYNDGQTSPIQGKLYLSR